MNEHNCFERLFPIEEGIYECIDCKRKYIKSNKISKFILKILYLLATLCGIFTISSLIILSYFTNILSFITVLLGLYGFIIFFEAIIKGKQNKINFYKEIDGD